jgi:RimJ/RimL family protein N-acetyltransferase
MMPLTRVEPPELADGHVLLRALGDTEAEVVRLANQDPDLRRWPGLPVPRLLEHALRAISDEADATGVVLAVEDRVTGDFLGLCGLVGIDIRGHCAQVGYWTAPGVRDRDVVVRALRLLYRWAFGSLGLRRLIWQAAVGDHASRLVALRTGFRIEGQLRLPHTGGTGGGKAWVGTLLATDLTATQSSTPDDADTERPTARAGPDQLAVRRAAVFAQPQPVLFAQPPGRTPSGGDATGAPGSTTGGELRLRPVHQRDVPAIVESCRDPATMRWTTVPVPYRRADAESFVREYAPGFWARGEGAVFALTDPNDAFLGTIDLRISPADPLVAEVGFMTAPAARGRGYCPVGLATVCAWGFTALGLARIEWRAYVGNVASRRVAEKAGFVLEGISRQLLDQRGERRDAWVGALIPADLRARS